MTLRSFVLVPVLVGSLALVAAGCGGSTSSHNGSGGSAGAAGASTGGSGGSGGSGATGGSGGSGGGPCTSNKDCAGNGLCGFWQKDGCSAKGSCFSPEPKCSGVDFACLCNGLTYNIACVGLPGGYVPAPVLYDAPCTDGGADGGGVDSGGNDSGSSDGGGAMFSCGSSLSCDSSTQYCKVTEGGACCNPPSYSCETIPTACAQDHTCTCMNSAVPGATCDTSNGGLTLTFAYP